jgi:hypothetical protein
MRIYLNDLARLCFSNVKHLEELRTAGYELPAVNQIEVGFILSSEGMLNSNESPILPMQLHPFCQQKEIVKYCKAHNIVVQAYCPIIRGQMDDSVIQEVATKVRADQVLNLDIPNYPFGASTSVTQLKFYVGGRCKKGAFQSSSRGV